MKLTIKMILWSIRSLFWLLAIPTALYAYSIKRNIFLGILIFLLFILTGIIFHKWGEDF